MKSLKYFLVFLVVTLFCVELIQNVDARGVDEPCSYLNTAKIRDSSGNCVLPSSGSTNIASQARSSSEPCSYLNPTKYIRDSSGNCVVAPQRATSQVAPVTAPTSTHSTTIIHTPTPVAATASSFGNISEIAMIFLIGFLAFIAYKIFGDRFRHPRTKYRPRSYPVQNSKNFVDNDSAVEDNSTARKVTDRWNGGYYDEDTMEESK
jgi:hypothetical protein